MEVVTETVRHGHEARTYVILDPAPPALLSSDLLRMLDIIRPSAREAEAEIAYVVSVALLAQAVRRLLTDGSVSA